MSYLPNLDTARAYLKVGRPDKALESLNRAIAAVPDSEKTPANRPYFKILMLLATVHLRESRPEQAAAHIEAGLQVKSDDTDLLFLNALFFMDRKRYDDMLAALVMYFLSVGDNAENDYEYADEKSLQQAFMNMLPMAYPRAEKRAEIAALIHKLAVATARPALIKAAQFVDELEGRIIAPDVAAS